MEISLLTFINLIWTCKKGLAQYNILCYINTSALFWFIIIWGLESNTNSYIETSLTLPMDHLFSVITLQLSYSNNWPQLSQLWIKMCKSHLLNSSNFFTIHSAMDQFWRGEFSVITLQLWNSLYGVFTFWSQVDLFTIIVSWTF